MHAYLFIFIAIISESTLMDMKLERFSNDLFCVIIVLVFLFDVPVSSLYSLYFATVFRAMRKLSFFFLSLFYQFALNVILVKH